MTTPPLLARLLPALLALPLLLTAGCTSTLRSPYTVPDEVLVELEVFDHAEYAAVLAEHVDDQGRVDYPALVAAPDRLERYIALLEAVGPYLRPDLFPTREDELAYYINAYNALTLYNVVQRYPIDSVDEDKVDFFFWTRFELDGEDNSLYGLENFIRDRYQEPRIHFALNCASAGCPRLPAVPFRGETLEAQLTEETARFLSEPRNVEFVDGELVLSEIFDWYDDDFPPDVRSWLAAQPGMPPVPPDIELQYRPYDWSLNDQTR